MLCSKASHLVNIEPAPKYKTVAIAGDVIQEYAGYSGLNAEGKVGNRYTLLNVVLQEVDAFFVATS